MTPKDELARLEKELFDKTQQFFDLETLLDYTIKSRNEYRAVALALLKEQEWISIKDRLPEIDREVLVYDGTIRTSCRLGLYWDESVFLLNEVLFWMPFPEPPKEKESI